MGASPGWSPEFFAQIDLYNQWKGVNPEQGQGGSASFADWIRGGSPEAKPGSALSVSPTGAQFKFPDQESWNPNGPQSLGDSNWQKWWGTMGVRGPEGDKAPFGSPGSKEADPNGLNLTDPTMKKRQDEAAASERAVRGRAATYFFGKDSSNNERANIFQRSLLGG